MRNVYGSPPLTRGIPVMPLIGARSPGFTPAHAGNTLSYPQTLLPCQVHPRSRGEYSCWWHFLFYNQGSPPLTRGIHCNVGVLTLYMGFTPAHAGNTKTIPFYADPTGVHPRSRGEYIKRTSKCNAGIGSPPLTRGILLL